MRALLIITFLVGVVCGELSLIRRCNKNSIFKEPSFGSCKGYWDCNQGVLKFSKCSYLYSFDNEKLGCVWNPFRSNKIPCGKNNGLKADAQWCKEGRYFKASVRGLCNNYYECKNGTLVIKNCIWPTQFNPQEQECLPNVWPMKFSCGESDEEVSVTTLPPDNGLTTTSSPDVESSTSDHQDVRPQCTKGRNFVAVDYENCNKFFSCFDGVLSSKDCGYFDYFDAARLECRTWFSVECTASNKTPNAPVTTIGPMTTMQPPKVDSKPVCLSTNYYTAIYQHDCKKYYLCSKGNIIVKECSFLQQFSPLKHECQYAMPFYSDCSKKPESPVCKPGYFFKTSYPGNDNTYYDCSNGILSVQKCGRFRKFIASTETCVFSLFGYELDKKISEPIDEWISQAPHLSTSDSSLVILDKTSNIKQEMDPTLNTKPSDNLINYNQKCNENSSFNFPYKGDCHKYHSCSNGSIKTIECEFGYKFDNRTQNCTVMTQCDLSNCYSKGPLCYPGITYLIPYSNNCKKYIECLDGVWSTKSCSSFHKFNPSTEKCEFSLFSNSNCFTSMKCDKTFFELSLNKKESVEVEKAVEFGNWKASGWPKCDPGQNFKTAFQYDCGKYLSCKNGNVTLESCSTFDKFDPKTLECRFNSPWDPVVCGTTPGKPVCEPSQSFKDVFPYDCAKYYDCDNGNLTVKKCSMFDKFDPKSLSCRFKWNFLNPINCDSPPGEPTCEKGKHFNSVYPDDCSMYYKCSDGVVSQEKCVLWKLFDPGSLQCRWNIPYIDGVNCSAVPGSDLVGKIKVRDTTKVKNEVKTSTEKDSAVEVAEPSCSAGQTYKAVYPNDCKKYFDCINGTENVEKCSWFKKFNPANYECRWDLPFYRVNCSAVPGSDLPAYPIKVSDACKSGKSFKAVDKSDCDSYFACSDGKLSYESCGMMEKFDPVSLRCKVDLPFHRVNCSALPGQPDCPKTGILRKPYPGNCRKYYECNNGTLSVIPCGFIQKFDQVKLTCRFDLFPLDCGDF